MKRLHFFAVLGMFTVAVFGAAFVVSAQTATSTTATTTAAVVTTQALPVTFPIAELGGCANEDACRVYCDDLAHKDACIAYGKTHGLLSDDEIEHAEKLPKVGPGGCTTETECRAYCADPAHQDVCLAFAEKHDLIEKTKIKAMKKVLKSGGPGWCTSEKECRVYCADPAHIDTCIAFAQNNDLLSEGQKKMMEMRKEIVGKLQEIGGPGGCTSEKECRAYCDDPAHVEECLAFATEHGMMEKGDAEDKIKDFILEAEKSIAQFSLERAHQYGEQMREHRFGKFEEFRKLEMQFRGEDATSTEGFSGPGGCTTPAECIQFCSDPANRNTCAKFNPSMGGMPPGEIFKNVEPGSEREFRRATSTEGKMEDMRKCGPMPARPTPAGCKGPICEDGRWGFKCENEHSATSSESTMGDRPEVCTQEYEPVCGENGKTYPNECYAKRDGMRAIKNGACGDLNTATSTSASAGERRMVMPYPIRTSPFLTPQALEKMREMQKDMPMLTPAESEAIPPQSRGISDLFFANVLQGFSGVFHGQ